MDRTPTLRIGERFGRFEIIDVLPPGGMGEVYRAKDPMLQRDVALKLLLGSEPHDLDRFEREAQTAAGFSHPNIVSIFERGTEQRGDQSFPYLVMEFIEGASLRARIKASKVQLLRWLTDVARGLAALHQRGVVHRDLKPENIMIGNDDRARIVDFGLAKADGTTITTTGTIVGTVDYFSPEQAAGRRLDYRTDIFSFGIVLYEALNGSHPFRAASVPETVRRIHYESPDRLPGRLGEIVARCLRKDPKDRYLDAADIARDLQEEMLPADTAKAAGPPPATVDPDARTIKMPSAGAALTRWRLIALTTLLFAAIVAIIVYEKRLPTAAPRLQAAPPTVHQTALTSAAMQQAALLPSCGLTGSPGKIKYGESARLRWSSSNAVVVLISPDIGIVGPNGSIDVSPHSNTTYDIVATSADGVAARGSVTIEVTNAPAGAKYVPVAGSIGVTPDTIRRGERTLLQWNSFGAARVLITPTVGIVPLEGRINVAPRSTTTYTLILMNDAGGNGSGTATVHVVDADTTAPMNPVTTEPLPGVDIGVSPPVISRGEVAHLTWSSVNATAVTINPILGTVTPKGSTTVAPTETTTYTITGISANGEPASASIMLTVQQH